MSVLKIKDANNQWIPIKSITGQPTAEQIQDAVDEYLENHPTVAGTFTNEAKNALLTLLEKVAYTVSDGRTYLDALRTELFRITVDSISAVFTQGSAVIYDTDSLNTLKQYLVVTANYSGGTSEEVTTYALSGTLIAGTSTITVSYGGETATFNVTVTAHPVQQDISIPLTISKTIINMADGVSSFNSSWYASDYIEIPDGMKTMQYTNNNSATITFRGAFYDSAKAFVNSALTSAWQTGSGKTSSKTIPSTAKYVRLSTNVDSLLSKTITMTVKPS